jgi:opacity protein-like surface antigen
MYRRRHFMRIGPLYRMRVGPLHRTVLALALLWVAAALGAAPAALAADPASGGDSGQVYSFKAGYWMPTEGVVSDILGGGVSFGGALSLPLRSNRWLDFELSYWKRSGDFPPLEDETLPGAVTERNSEVTLVPLSLSLRVEALPMRGVKPFFLGGVDLNVVKEEVAFVQTQPDEPDLGGTNSLSNAFLGFHFGGGAEMDVRAQTPVFFEVRVSVVNADTDDVGGLVGNGVSLGGIGIFGGVRFK